MHQLLKEIPVRTSLQAGKLQRLCFDAAMSFRVKIPTDEPSPISREDATALANLVKAWDTARDAVRVAKGKPLPGSLRPKDKPRRPKRGSVTTPYAEPQGAAPEVMLGQPSPEPNHPSPSDPAQGGPEPSEGEQPAS